MNWAIVPHNFEPIPFVEHLNSRAVDASPDDGHALVLPTNDCYTDQSVVLRDFVADELAGLDADFEPVDVAGALVVALTFAEFVDLSAKLLFNYQIS